MKSIRSILFVSLLLLAGVWEAAACIGSRFFPRGYRTFRIQPFGVDTMWIGDRVNGRPKLNNDWNCELWQRQTCDTLPVEAIARVVFKYSVDQMRRLRAHAAAGESARDRNSFAQWLVHNRDTDALDLLILAKQCEAVRWQMQDPWYYPDGQDELHGTLDSIYREAMAPRRTRFRDRYLLQAMRALFSMGRYDECVTLWNRESGTMRPSVIRNMTGSYAAGACFRLRDADRAAALYIECDDVDNAAWCLGERYPARSAVEQMECIYNYYPRAAELTRRLQRLITSWEDGLETRLDWGRPYELDSATRVECERLKQFALRVVGENRVAEPVVWQYAAAYLTDMMGDTKEARRLLAQTERMERNELVEESIRMLDIYLEAQTATYNAAYEKRLRKQLEWIEERMADGIRRGVDTLVLFSGMSSNQSCFYPNDMIRKIMLAVVIPRSMQQGNLSLALLAANYGDNRLSVLLRMREQESCVHECFGYPRDLVFGSRDMVYPYVPAGQEDWRLCNSFDYSNDYFRLMDTVPLRELIAHVEMLEGKRGGSALERFLRDRVYVDADYLNDLIGTRCLREMDYPQARKYLARVSAGYQRRLNTDVYMWRNPFEESWVRAGCDLQDDFDYKLNFATRMCELEEKMRSDDPVRSEEATFRYATGICNSFERCWALTAYHRSAWIVQDRDTSPVVRYEAKCTGIWQRLRDSSRNPELQARCQMALTALAGTQTQWLYKTEPRKTQYEQLRDSLQRRFSETKAEEYFASVCDNYRMYIEKNGE